MASHFYRLRMGAYAETLFRCSKREKLQMIWLQCNLMRLGSEVIRSKHWSIAADQPVRHEHGAAPIDHSGKTAPGDLKQIGREARSEAPTMCRPA